VQILILNQSEVRQLLPMAECIEVMAERLKTLARDRPSCPFALSCATWKSGGPGHDAGLHGRSADHGIESRERLPGQS